MTNKKVKIKTYRPLPLLDKNLYNLGAFINNAKDKIGGIGGGNGLSSGTSGLVSGIGSAVNMGASKLLSHGLSSGAGKAVSNIGNAVGGAVGKVNPLLGAAVLAATGIIGGGINALFGSNLNQENIDRVKNANTAMNQMQVDDSSAESVAQAFSNADFGFDFDKDFIGKEGIFSNAATNAFNSLQAARQAALNRAYASLGNAATNVDNTMDMNMMANFGAFGGHLNTHGADFSSGLVHIDNGGTHELNPNEGIQVGVDPQGVPNLVEEGEVIWDDYVFSNRLKVPKKIKKEYKLGGRKSMTFADAVKEVSKEAEERPNDPISSNGLIDSLSRLKAVLEDIRLKQQARQMMKLLQALPEDQQMQLLLGMMGQDQGMPGMEQGGMPIDAMMGGMQGLNMGAFGGRRVNKYKYAGELYQARAPRIGGTFVYDDDIDTSKLPQSFIDRRNAVSNNLNDPRVRQWVKDYYVPYINDFNKKYNPNATPITPEYITKDIFDKKTSDGLFGGFYAGLGDVHLPFLTDSSGNLIFGEDGNPIFTVDLALNASDNIPAEESVLQTVTDTDAAKKTGASLADQAKFRALDEEWRTRNKFYADYLSDKNYNTYLQYAPAVGNAGLVLTDALGLTNKADNSAIDSAMATIASLPLYQPVSADPIGNFLTYRPFDIEAYTNKANAHAGAVNRDIMNISGGNIGSAMAGLISNSYNTTLNIGDTMLKAALANREHEKDVHDANTDILKFNSLSKLLADLANQATAASAQQTYNTLLMEAAKTRMLNEQAAAATRGANVSNLFTSLGELGKDAQNRKDLAMLAQHGVLEGLTPRYLKDLLGENGALKALTDRGWTLKNAKRKLGIK